MVVAQAQRQAQTFLDELKRGTLNYRIIVSLNEQIVEAYRARRDPTTRPGRVAPYSFAVNKSIVTKNVRGGRCSKNPTAETPRDMPSLSHTRLQRLASLRRPTVPE